MKTIVKFTFLIFCSVSFGQTNLLDTSTWTVGSGSVTGFSRNGTDAENIREIGTNPYGDPTVLWKAVPDATSNADGGWNGSYFNIDHTKTYRFTVWIKKSNSTNGTTYFGLYTRDAAGNHTTLELSGTARSNAYFWYGDLPELDKWYLLVGVVHGSAHSGTTMTGGIYDGATGVKVLNAQRDFKFTSNATRLMHRSYLFYDTNTLDRQFFWGPTIYEVNGQEPTIAELINPGGNTGGGDTVWNTAGSDINYTTGQVGIGTASPDEALTVKGKIHTQEVRVDLLGAVAPDYVFYKDYDLRTLKEVQQFIDEHGHLPNIPSAAEMERNGVSLKEMNLKLLEKIEELTLYILEQEKEIEDLRKILLKNNIK